MEIIKARDNSEPANINVDSAVKHMKVSIPVIRRSKYRDELKELEYQLTPIKEGRKSAFIDNISF